MTELKNIQASDEKMILPYLDDEEASKSFFHTLAAKLLYLICEKKFFISSKNSNSGQKMNRNRVFLPLRSNIGWFQSANLKNMISNRVKEAILIYDELYIEDGTFQATIFENGSFSPYFPPGFVSPDERTIECERDLKPTRMGIAAKHGEHLSYLDMEFSRRR